MANNNFTALLKFGRCLVGDHIGFHDGMTFLQQLFITMLDEDTGYTLM